MVLFDGGRATRDYCDLEELVLTYGVMLRKSQGSEYPCVVIPSLTHHYVMLERNLNFSGMGEALPLIMGNVIVDAPERSCVY